MVEKNTKAANKKPYVVFIGDGNVGKSTLINALLREKTIPTALDTTTKAATFVSKSRDEKDRFWELSINDRAISSLSFSSFQTMCSGSTVTDSTRFLLTELPTLLFPHLVLIDTKSMSNMQNEIPGLNAPPETHYTLCVLMVDVEYWAARHTLEFIQLLNTKYKHFIIVANKADQINASDIRFIRNSIPKRLRKLGINPPPRTIVLSAQLELSRKEKDNEYRISTKQPVVEMCDAGFDALRVALYEFEVDFTHKVHEKFKLDKYINFLYREKNMEEIK